MGIEVMPRRGEVRVRDAREALGDGFVTARSVDLLVLDADGHAPVSASIELVDLASGARVHRVFSCPACQSAVRLLIARMGRLACRRCQRARTRRQMERTRADWRRHGGASEDVVIRLLLGPAP